MVTGPVDIAALIPTGQPNGGPHRRPRIATVVDPELRGWLQRAARAHAHIAAIVRLYGNPSKAGGQSLLGETYAARVARGDRTILHDCVTYARDELDGIRADIETRMNATPPTRHPPGSRAKVDVMAARLEAGDSLFVAGDSKE